MIIATAGHVDHGKTSLVRALTGIETDRLPEEHARGISIDLGFAHWRPEAEVLIGFVDVPGHERFVRNMLAGVAGVDFALIVIAADDGVMPQTIEHAQILDFLGISRGAIAITKCDRANADQVVAVRDQIAHLLGSSPLAAAPVLEVSSSTRSGVDDLGRLLAAAARSDPSRLVEGRNFRMAIDRAFTVTGAGTVVTGTILDGTATTGDRLVLSPAGIAVRIRGLQRAGSAVDQASAGERCAINLAGVELADVRRGDWLTVPMMRVPTPRMEVRLQVVEDLERPLKHDTRVHMHIGTADIPARVLVPKQGSIYPGSDKLVLLALDEPTLAVTGDPFVIRDQSGQHLIGGGRVIIPSVPSKRRKRENLAAVAAAFERVEPDDALEALLGIHDHETDARAFARSFNLTEQFTDLLFDRSSAIVLGSIAVPRNQIDRVRVEVVSALSNFHREQPKAAGMPIRTLHQKIAEAPSRSTFGAILKLLASEGQIQATASLAKLAGYSPVFSDFDTTLWRKVFPWLDERGPRLFTAEDVAKEARTTEASVQAMLYQRRSSGDVWRVNPTQFLLGTHVAALAASAAQLSEGADNDGFTAAQYRDATGIGRNLTIKLLEFFDTIRVTARRGDKRRIVRGYEEIVGTAAAFAAESSST